MTIITRNTVIEQLRRWTSGELSAVQILQWASEIYLQDQYDFEDWENSKDSVAKEIVAKLDMLDLDLITEEDIPAMIEFLETPIGDFGKGYEKFVSRISSTDFELRKVKLRGVQPYIVF